MNIGSCEDVMSKLVSLALASVPLVAVVGAMIVT